ncbi:hypothetical protein E4T48_01185 [Aureobasidium sp. EXF-10727]|nr:hypothetical protein E4T48_01185 [Aureobasidium sp. EXF-10727]
MGLWNNAPPEPRTRRGNWPTLLFSWWCTAFAAVIILTRLAGRKIRSGRLFQEDKVMALSLIPLLARMGLVHVILMYGTNNVQSANLTPYEIYLRQIGSRLVLASRINYALFIWISKFTVSEFLKRITSAIWRRSYEIVLHCIRVFLVATFIAVVIATLSECQPFNHYWQVVPDPGPQCRQGYAQLITMGTADMITDILLVGFPIPIVLRSQIALKRKLSLVCLFSFSVALIVITGLRMPNVIKHHGRQQYRTVWASVEILASAAVSNAIILGTFVKDRGVKRNKYRPDATLDTISRADTRRATLESIHRDSEEALFRQMGVRMPDELCEPKSPLPRPAPVARISSNHKSARHDDLLMSRADISDGPPSPHDSADALRKPSETAPSTATGQSVSFFDVGGLLGGSELRNGSSGTTTQDFAIQGPRTPGASRPTQDILSDLGGRLSLTRSRSQRASGNRERSRSRPTQSRDGTTGSRPGSRSQRQREDSNTLSLQDIGGLLGGSLPNQSRPSQQEPISPTTRAPPSSIPPDSQAPPIAAPTITRQLPASDDLDLQDVGGLLK